jgi:hypothetical protein
MLPLNFQEDVPRLLDSPLGFGTLQMRVSRSVKEGLVLQPKLELTVRLPGSQHLETFPSIETLAALKAITKEPELVRNASSTGIRNIAKQSIQRTRDNEEFWHKQPLRGIAKKSSFEPEFTDRAKTSIKVVKQIIRKAEVDVNAARLAVAGQERQMADLTARRNSSGGEGLARALAVAENGMAQLRQRLSQAEARMAVARRLGPAIDAYCADLAELMVDFDEQHESLMQDYDAIVLQVDELLDASKSGRFQLRCEMTATLQTPQAENGPSVRIHFIEASSQRQ